MEGYSNLQNQYYIRILENENTYYDFPKNIYSNIDKLRENSYDSVESTIDYVILKIEQSILSKSGQDLESWLQQNKSPFSGYYETCEESQNTMIQFCEKLISDYCYPKEKIIEFLKNYLVKRYNVMSVRHGSTNNGDIFMKYSSRVTNKASPCGNNRYYVQSYIILLDTWWQNKGGKDDNEYFNNLYFVNKSNLFRANSLTYAPDIDDLSDINYFKEKNNILAIPMYLYGLMDEDESDESEEDDYSSTCADDGLSDDESE